MNDRENQPKAVATGASSNTLNARINDALRKNRIILLVVLCVLAAGIVGITGYTIIRNGMLEKATAGLEALSFDFDAWSAEQDETAKSAKAEALLKACDLLAAKTGYPAAESLVMKARILEQKKDWAEAEKAFAAVAERFGKLHLAAASLMNASVMAEERGDAEAAKAYLERLVKDYPATTGIAHAYFSLGRLFEGAKDYAKANEQYLLLTAKYPDNESTKLAKDRIIHLKAQGLVP